ncbi:response regulator [Fictibacillus sp. Mic-4]|uniref:response regulator n=1 Tax=Fictibacillus TaxID=1329200 RepID=UPI00042943A6|nr:response regulator [Fictibacillus gelatini]
MHKIMMVVENPQIAELFRTYMDNYGYEAIVVDDFDNILHSFLSIQPDLVLMTVNLPGYDGYYWSRQIREVSNCPILFISDRFAVLDEMMIHENGAADYIAKPFSFEAVTRKIRAHLYRAYGDYSQYEAFEQKDINGKSFG